VNPLEILLVDDDEEWAEDFRPNLKKVLPARIAQMGWDSVEIRHAKDQQDANGAVQSKAPDEYDLVLLDLRYPESPILPLPDEPEQQFQGMKWLPTLRRLQPHAAIVIITGYPYEDRLINVVNAIRDCQANDFIPKVAVLDETVGRICVALSHARHIQALRRLEEEFHRLLRSHAASVLADDGGRLIEQTVARFRRIAGGIKSGDPTAIKAAPNEISAECRTLKERYMSLADFFYTLEAKRQGEVDIGELARQMLLLYDWRIKEARAEAKPPVQQGVKVTTYECDLRIALHEVLCNAIDSLMDSDTEPANCIIEVQVEMGEGQAFLRIIDNGPGFSDQAMQDMFEPKKSTRKDGEHQGLGLYIARHMMQAIGGSIEPRNRPEGGAEVVLVVPSLVKP